MKEFMKSKVVKVAAVIVVFALVVVGASYGILTYIDKSAAITASSEKKDVKNTSDKKETKKTDKKKDQTESKDSADKTDVAETDESNKNDTTAPTNKNTASTNSKNNSNSNTGSNGNSNASAGAASDVPVDELGRPLWDNGQPVAYSSSGLSYNPNTSRVMPNGGIMPKNYLDVSEPLPYPEWVDNGDSIEVCGVNDDLAQKAYDTLMERYPYDQYPNSNFQRTDINTGYLQDNNGIVQEIYRTRIAVVFN